MTKKKDVCVPRRAGVAFGIVLLTAVFALADPSRLAAQTAAPAGHQHQPEPHPDAAHRHEVTAEDVLEIPEAREASGTSWLPDTSPMHALHANVGEWQLMGHGNVFVQYLQEGSERGREQFGSINWVMLMARRQAGAGRFGLRGMVSLEPWTIRGCGYPDLLATGEVCDGHVIHDEQHPHDLFMEVAADYDRPLSNSVRLQLYGGLAGEPALGPVAFPHRLSAMPNPLAPISHHWFDATHITYGVVTGGVYGRKWKAEASVFNGREPDEERRDFDLAALDSVSGRLWFLPTDSLAFQVSTGRLEDAEPGHEGHDRVDLDRVTASGTYHRLFRADSLFAATLAWGRNTEEGESTNTVMAEAQVTFDEQDTWFGRVELGEKAAHDLDLHGLEGAFTVGKLQAGYVRYLEAWKSVRPGVGVTGSMSLVPNSIERFYGNRASFGFGLFVTLRPAAMVMGAGGHQGH